MPKTKDKSEYLLLGSNNFWYATCATKKEALVEAKFILKHSHNSYGNEEDGYTTSKPKEIFIYKATLIN